MTLQRYKSADMMTFRGNVAPQGFILMEKKTADGRKVFVDKTKGEPEYWLEVGA